jgi:hypothetical protein
MTNKTLNELRMSVRGRPFNIYTNITFQQAQELLTSALKHTEEAEIRGYIISPTEILWWDAWFATHGDIVDDLGIDYVSLKRIYLYVKDGKMIIKFTVGNYDQNKERLLYPGMERLWSTGECYLFQSFDSLSPVKEYIAGTESTPDVNLSTMQNVQMRHEGALTEIKDAKILNELRMTSTDGRPFNIWVNLPYESLKQNLDATMGGRLNGALRGYTLMGNVYWWDAHFATHWDVARELFGEPPHELFCLYFMTDRNNNVPVLKVVAGNYKILETPALKNLFGDGNGEPYIYRKEYVDGMTRYTTITFNDLKKQGLVENVEQTTLSESIPVTPELEQQAVSYLKSEIDWSGEDGESVVDYFLRDNQLEMPEDTEEAHQLLHGELFNNWFNGWALDQIGDAYYRIAGKFNGPVIRIYRIITAPKGLAT